MTSRTAARHAWPPSWLYKPWTSGGDAELSSHLGDSVPVGPAPPADAAARSTAAMSSVTKGDTTGELLKDELTSRV